MAKSTSAWTVTDSNGITHTLEVVVKAFTGLQIKVDTNTYRVKSSNWFINLIDYTVDLPGANCHIVMIGNKARLAVNGVYQDDGSKYEPVSKIPAWIWVLVAISVIGGWFFGGIICCAIGAAFSTVYISAFLQNNTKKTIGFFVGFLLILAVFLALNLGLAFAGAI